MLLIQEYGVRNISIGLLAVLFLIMPRARTTSTSYSVLYNGPCIASLVFAFNSVFMFDENANLSYI